MSHMKHTRYTLSNTNNVLYAKQIQDLIQCQKELGTPPKAHV